jgi:hypothetical protein
VVQVHCGAATARQLYGAFTWQPRPVAHPGKQRLGTRLWDGFPLLLRFSCQNRFKCFLMHTSQQVHHVRNCLHYGDMQPGMEANKRPNISSGGCVQVLGAAVEDSVHASGGSCNLLASRPENTHKAPPLS